jgi:hypothetical protein
MHQFDHFVDSDPGRHLGMLVKHVERRIGSPTWTAQDVIDDLKPQREVFELMCHPYDEGHNVWFARQYAYVNYSN